MIAAFAFALGAVGLWLVATPPPPPPLARLMGTTPHAMSSSGTRANVLAQLGGWAARYPWGDWLRTHTRTQDLELLGRSPDGHLGTKLALAAAGFTLPVFTVTLLAIAGLAVAPAVPLWVGVLLAAFGFLLPDVQRASAAAAERQDLRQAVEDFAEITGYGLRSGSGLATALVAAAQRLRGRFGDDVLAALREAQFNGTSPWAALDDLGRRLGLPDLCEVAAAVQQAGTDGASVAASLEAKATGLARRALAEREAAAVPATSRMLVRSIALALCALAILYGPLLMRVRHL